MKYLKVKWLHDLDNEPVLLYSELASDRSEVRKVEVFRNGVYGYASADMFKGTTQLSEGVIPMESEIAEDQQFIVEVIAQEEFENIWRKATTK